MNYNKLKLHQLTINKDPRNHMNYALHYINQSRVPI